MEALNLYNEIIDILYRAYKADGHRDYLWAIREIAIRHKGGLEIGSQEYYAHLELFFSK